jgi:myo-inositol-1(or 4)-monophosphatase
MVWVLVALLHKEEPVAAGMYLPFYDLLYMAEKGRGAYRNGERISVSPETALCQVLLAYSLDYSEDQAKIDRETQLIGKLVRSVRNLRSTNSAVDFC